MTAATTTIPSVRRARLAAAPAAPLLTWYDLATGERVELSATTFDGWVAKTAGLVRDVVGLQHGDVVAIDLPPHWLAPVWLAACAELGLATWPGGQPRAADLAVCGPEGIEAALAAPDVMAVSLLPLAMPFAAPLPPGADDYCLEVRSAPDRFSPSWPVSSDDVLLRLPDGDLTHAGALAAARGLAESHRLGDAARLLVDDRDDDAQRWLLGLVVPLLLGGSVVLVTGGGDDDRVARIAAEEGAVRLRPSA